MCFASLVKDVVFFSKGVAVTTLFSVAIAAVLVASKLTDALDSFVGRSS
jgi:hypothetical protein